jgi:multicomponent Na+:H+ antiporter subunit D
VSPFDPQLALAMPAAGAVLIAATGRWPNLRETITVLTAISLLYVVVSLVPAVLSGQTPSSTLATMMPGLSIRLVVEPLGMLFALVASALWIVNSIYSIGYMRGNKEHQQTRFYVCFAISLAATMGISFAGNLLTLFLFYEILTLSTYPLVTHHGDAEAKRAGRIYLGLLLGTSIGFLLLAIVWTWSLTGTLDFVRGGILANRADSATTGILLALYMFGIGKAALMPIHRWLPAAMVAPTPVSALLHAVAVVKAGVFTVVKVIVYVFGVENLVGLGSGSWLAWVAGFTIIAASVIALRSDNLKRRLAYSTVSQLSYVTLAAALLAPASVIGAGFHIAAHAVSKITLFFAAGAIYTASHKTEVSQLDGIGRRMPITMTAFTIGALSLIGIPPAVGFISKWYIISGAAESGQFWAIAVLIVSTLLNAGYFLPIVYAAFFKPAPDSDHHGEAPLPIIIALSMTATLTVALFFFADVPLTLATATMTHMTE